jgi:zinc protease
MSLQPDRINGPIIVGIGDGIQLPILETAILDNGLLVHSYVQPNAEVVQLSVVFKAGLWYHPTELVSSLTNRLMKEGTRNHSSKAIAEAFDFYGASLYNQHDSDFASYTVTCLKKHLPTVLPLLAEVLQQPTFEEAELQLQCKLGKEAIKLEKEKTENMAGQAFFAALYGEKHPYGRVNKETHYDAVTTELLKAYHQSHYHPGNAFVFIAGAIDSSLLKLLNSNLGTTQWATKTIIEAPQYNIESGAHHEIYLEKKDAVQSALRLGQRTIDGKHEDFNDLKIATVVLGGYFGSRLMSSIREEKGYTYGIHSTISNRVQDAVFRISTEVGSHVRKEAVAAIYEEIDALQQDLIDQEELDQVRNYLLGNYMDSLSNIFSTANLLNNMIAFDRTPADFYKNLNALKNCTPATIQTMAQRYFKTKDWYEVVAG